MSQARLSGWGRFPIVESALLVARDMAAAQGATAAAAGLIARGNGRAYGDAAIGTQQTLDLRPLDRMRTFDPKTALLEVEAGVLLHDIIQAFAPRGYFPAVVPGTRYVTVGGAIAADVHGKNHHREGSFGAHVESLRLAIPGGEVLHLSRFSEADLFAATLGGMGLTGTILSATLRLRRIETGWIRQRTIAAPDLAAAMAALDAADDATYSVAWIDCLASGPRLGRALIFIGEHAAPGDLAARALPRVPALRPARLALPLDLPGFALNRWSMAAFNRLYYRRHAARARAEVLQPLDAFFFPLDAIADWNRLYGRRGFVQHQCVIPTDRAPGVLAAILGRISAQGGASFLATLKKLGPAAGPLSFPQAGFTLTLDFPMRAGLPAFLQELDALVVAGGGRLYLAKDACQSRATFEVGYPQLDRFRGIRRAVDPRACLRSHLAQRLGL